MEIKLSKKPSKEVLEFSTIEHDAKAMSRLLRRYVSPTGKASEDHYAIHHSQFSGRPYNFFVINSWVVGASELQTVVVVNPKIIEKKKEDRVKSSEACMSFPFRRGVKVNRYKKITVAYQTPDEEGKKLIDKESVYTDQMAFIFQHEIQHGHGHNIYEGTNVH